MKRFAKLCFPILLMIVFITGCGDKGSSSSPPSGSHANTGPDTTNGAHIYVADSGNARIAQMDDLTGAGWVTLGTRGTGTNQFGGPEGGYSPTGVFVDTAGKIYAADKTNCRIIRVDDITGANWTALGAACSGEAKHFDSPTGIFVVEDTAGKTKIYVADMGNSRIVRVDDMEGSNWTTFGSSGSGANEFNRPIGVFVDTNGKIYVVDQVNSRIVRIDDMSGAGWTSLGTRGSGANQFASPAGIFVDSSGKIYVTDASIFENNIEVVSTNRIVRVNDMTGAGWTTFGNTGSGDNQFTQPAGIFVDTSGRIYIVDQFINRVVRVDDMAGAGWRTLGCYGTDPATVAVFDGIRSIFIR